MSQMTLSEELTWRGFVNQTTYKSPAELDGDPISFYWGVDPSSDSMQIGNLAAAMMVKAFIKHGHKAILLVGGATGLIGDPDGKNEERSLKPMEEVVRNKQALAAQYQQVFGAHGFSTVDNYDWFQDFKYLDFLRDVGKHVPMRQMLQREFVQSRLGEDNNGISYAEFSYALMQGYDFLHLYQEQGVTLQVSGADQWGNSLAGVDLIRRKTGAETNVYTTPLIINKKTGKKFGKSEAGAIWLDATKTSPTEFYQFWINLDDEGVEDYLKVYTELDKPTIDTLMERHRQNPQARLAQEKLAQEVTKLVHGEAELTIAETVTAALTGKKPVAELDDEALGVMRHEIACITVSAGSDIADALVSSNLAASKTEARRLLMDNAITVNGQRTTANILQAADFQNGRLLLRRGKAFKDTALVELG
jgi:tyrosyl-tRNA synthetase